MADSYGTSEIFDDLRDLFETNLNLLKTAVASMTAKFDYVYNRHSRAKLLLNAVSCDFDTTEQEPAGHSQGLFTDYTLHMTVRIHTGYVGRSGSDPVDTQEIGRLIDSVNNWFMTHLSLSANYRIIELADISAYSEFDESATFGASLTYAVQYTQDHVQI